jgi:carboxymethylenebutenolidase
MPESNGRTGAVGFCLGGSLAFATAATSRVDGRGLDAAVCYYGSAINGMLDQVSRIECPLMFHYGEEDPFIPAEKIAEVEAAVTGQAGLEFYRYAAGHAFCNEDFPSVYNASAAGEAWPRTLGFLARHLRD